MWQITTTVTVPVVIHVSCENVISFSFKANMLKKAVSSQLGKARATSPRAKHILTNATVMTRSSYNHRIHCFFVQGSILSGCARIVDQSDSATNTLEH